VSRILVVDDDTECRVALRALLESWTHYVDEAADGGSALAIARDHRPDIVLLDVGLPDVSGYDVAEEIRGTMKPAPYVVALTGSEDDGVGGSCFDAYLVKPADPDRLRELLGRAAAKR